VRQLQKFSIEEKETAQTMVFDEAQLLRQSALSFSTVLGILGIVLLEFCITELSKCAWSSLPSGATEIGEAVA
jgi:hypothetical protein